MSGEVMVTLGGQVYALRPTFGALMALEKEHGTGLLTLARRFAEGAFTLEDCVAVVAAGIRGAGGVVPPNLAELVFAVGIQSVAVVIAHFLKGALTGEEPEVSCAGKG